MTSLVSGSALVLVAQVPRASDRWQQVHFNKKIMEQFFRQTVGSFVLERVDNEGFLAERKRARIVYAQRNKNYKIEFDFSPVRQYPSTGVPLLLVLELDIGMFRYRALVPGSPGYEPMLELNQDSSPIGRGKRRIISTLDDVELRWSQVRLRNPKSRELPQAE